MCKFFKNWKSKIYTKPILSSFYVEENENIVLFEEIKSSVLGRDHSVTLLSHLLKLILLLLITILIMILALRRIKF